MIIGSRSLGGAPRLDNRGFLRRRVKWNARLDGMDPEGKNRAGPACQWQKRSANAGFALRRGLLARIIHEHFCCNVRFAAATSRHRVSKMPAGRLAPRDLNVLFQVRLGPLGLRVPVSLGDSNISRRTVMNNVRQALAAARSFHWETGTDASWAFPEWSTRPQPNPTTWTS